MPSRAEIQPEALPDLMPHMYIIDVLSSPRRYRVRIAGARVVREFRAGDPCDSGEGGSVAGAKKSARVRKWPTEFSTNRSYTLRIARTHPLRLATLVPD